MEDTPKHIAVGRAVQIDQSAENGKTYIAIVEGINDDGTAEVNGWGTMPVDELDPADPYSEGVRALEHNWEEDRRAQLIKGRKDAELRMHGPSGGPSGP